METYLVIYTTADGVTKHAFLMTDTPDSTNGLAFGLSSDDTILAVVDVAESAVDAIWIDEEVVHPSKDIDPAAEHAEAGVVHDSTTQSSD